jgi:UDP-N-acetylmuramyl pentapeptide phosphotransferase/UDP-N-acetylglucosamine-1-phosphate transferase
LLKLLGGLGIGVVCVPAGLVESLRGGLLIAASANLVNLFDRAPGRAIKVSVVGALLVGLVSGVGWVAAPTMLVVGAGLGLLAADLREECMLGDTGANVLGAAVGYGLVLGLGATGEWIAVAVVVAANLSSERVSFGSLIDRVGLLRWIDRLGCRPERRRA